MILKKILKATLIPILVLGLVTSCDKNEGNTNLDIRIDKVVVNNEGDFTFMDSLIYLVCDTSQYEIKIQTEPKDADMFYSKNTDDFIKMTENWILIDSTFKTIRFYSQVQGYNKTDIHEIDFGFNNDSIITKVNLYPNPFVDNINFHIESKNIRGEFDYKIIDVTGKIISTETVFISGDEIEKNIDLSDLSNGIYLIQFDFGNSKLINKIIKQ
jgi:hypothetical protein